MEFNDRVILPTEQEARKILAKHPEAMNGNVLRKRADMAYSKEEAPIVISKQHRDLLKKLADKDRRPMKATMEILIEKATAK